MQINILFDSDSLIDVGFVTRTALNNLVSSGDIGAEDEKRFYEGARSFFIEAFEYAVSHMPVNDELLVNVEMVYFEEREKLEPSMVQYFVQRYSTKVEVLKSTSDCLEKVYKTPNSRSSKNCSS